MSERIAIIESELSARQVLVRFTEREGYDAVALDRIEEIGARRRNLVGCPIAFVAARVDDGVALQAANRLRAVQKDIAIVLMTDGESDDDLAAAQQIDAAFFVPRPVPYNVFRLAMRNALRAHEARRQLEARRRFRNGLIAWYRQALGRLRLGQFPSYRQFLEQVCVQLARVFDVSGVTVLSSPDGGADWKIVFDSLIGPSVADLPVLEGADLLASLVELGSAQTFSGDLLPLRGRPFDHWRRNQLALIGQPLHTVGGGVAWILRRTAQQPMFRPWELELLEDVQTLIGTLLDSALAIQRAVRDQMHALEEQLAEDFAGTLEGDEREPLLELEPLD